MIAGGALVLRIDVGVDEEDRDGQCSFLTNRLGDVGMPGEIERNQDLALAVDPLFHLEAKAPLDQGGKPLKFHVVEARAAESTDFKDVAKALRGDQGDLDAFALDDRIRRDSRAVR